MKTNERIVTSTVDTSIPTKPRSFWQEVGELAKVTVASVVVFGAVLAIIVPHYL